MRIVKKYLFFWTNILNFSGRASRSEFWCPTIVNFILLVLLKWQEVWTVFKYKEYSVLFTESTSLSATLFTFFLMLSIIPSISCCVRRLHDINKSGKMAFLMVLPVVGQIILLPFLVKRGNHSINSYGRNPLEIYFG